MSSKKLIGENIQGKFYLVNYIGYKVARKEVQLNGRDTREITLVIDEINILKKLKHKNIISIVDFDKDTNRNDSKCNRNGYLCDKIDEKRLRNEDFAERVYSL